MISFILKILGKNGIKKLLFYCLKLGIVELKGLGIDEIKEEKGRYLIIINK